MLGVTNASPADRPIATIIAPATKVRGARDAGGRAGALEATVDRRAGDAEQLGELARGVLAGAVQPAEVGLLACAEL